MWGKMITKSAVGNAGINFVKGELLKMGHIPAEVSRGTENIDLICSNSDYSKQIVLQIKTTQKKPNKWILTDKIFNIKNIDKVIFIFVNIYSKLENPKYFIVPGKDVIQYCYNSHKQWLSTPKKNGDHHKDSVMRNFKDDNEEYLNRWDLLNI